MVYTKYDRPLNYLAQEPLRPFTLWVVEDHLGRAFFDDRRFALHCCVPLTLYRYAVASFSILPAAETQISIAS